jgi:hypothetical protein
MKEIKILQILKSFSAEERTLFREFANSDFFRKNRKYNELLDSLEKYIEKGSLSDLKSRGKFQETIFRVNSLKNQTLRNRLNELTKLGEKFIMFRELDKDGDLRALLFLRGLKDRKLIKLFETEFNKIPDITNYRKFKSHIISDILWLDILVQKENRNFQAMFSNYNKQIEYIYTYFLEMLFDSAKEYEIERMYNVNLTADIFESVISNLNAKKLMHFVEGNNNPAYRRLIINYYLYKSFSDINDTASFEKLQKIFYDNINDIEDFEKNSIMTDLISLYFYKINRGETEYLKDVFKLYKLKLKLGLYDELRYIRYPSSAFRDYIVVGIRLKQFAWVEDFIKKYSPEVPEEIREEETCMGYARLYFSKKEYLKSLEMLNKLETSNYLYILDASNNKLRVFYELLNFEEAFLEIDRIKHYIKNNPRKIASSVKKYNMEFLDKYNKLLRLRLSPDRRELGFFHKNVRESATLVTKNWFIEKIGELQ